jgi:predicted GNAT family acetyltransferase
VTREITITREDRPAGGRYVARIGGMAAEAELTYTRRRADLVSADHTEVPPAARDRGVGRALLERLVMDARREGVKIIPRCSYLAAERRNHPDWADVFVG